MRAGGKRGGTGSWTYSGLTRSCILWLFVLILTAFSFFSLLPGSLASPDEVYGVVTNVIDGDTFDLRIEKADSRIENSVERIALADVRSPDMKTIKGPAARDFTYALLMDRRIYLDVDDFNQGRDGEGRLVAVAYLAGAYGQPIPYPNFNLLLVDSGHAVLDNQADNEFDPKDWREGTSSESSSSDPLQKVEESLRERLEESLNTSGQDQQGQQNDIGQKGSQNDLLSRIEDAAGERLDRAGQAAWDWLKAEITNTSLELVNSSLDRALNHS